ncbi:hypothetical protein [Methylobacterium segetis]|uniref:hypothetical protein n=1 Tax=Methylobacterium segetis TaxID=2488750 RepID=UPI001FDF8B9B|nr:hypothetical protein [Methylobacterium segetis]
MRRDRIDRSQLIAAAALALLAAAPGARAQAPEGAEKPREERETRDPVNNWSMLRAALAQCWQVPDATEGSTIAFRFGLDKTGAIRGTPLVTARRLVGDQDAKDAYEKAAFAALDRCFPIPVTPSFGAALGESPIRLRFVNTEPTAAYQINSNITIFAPR